MSNDIWISITDAINQYHVDAKELISMIETEQIEHQKRNTKNGFQFFVRRADIAENFPVIEISNLEKNKEFLRSARDMVTGGAVGAVAGEIIKILTGGFMLSQTSEEQRYKDIIKYGPEYLSLGQSEEIKINESLQNLKTNAKVNEIQKHLYDVGASDNSGRRGQLLVKFSLMEAMPINEMEEVVRFASDLDVSPRDIDIFRRTYIGMICGQHLNQSGDL